MRVAGFSTAEKPSPAGGILAEGWGGEVAEGEGLETVFRTITSADWARELPRARAVPNGVRDQIREKILALGLGKSQPEVVGESDQGRDGIFARRRRVAFNIFKNT